MQAAEPQLVESKDPGTETSDAETGGGQGVIAEMEETGKEDIVPQQREEEASAGDTEKTQTAASKPAEGDAEEAGQDKDKASTHVDMTDGGPTDGEKEGQAERTEDKKGMQAKNSEAGKDGEKIEDKNEGMAKTKTVPKSNEEGNSENGKTVKLAEKKKDVKKVGGEAKDKEKLKEGEKQGKTKRKSGPSSALSRPRPSARSIRASAKSDIIAKFQQGAPE